jgi:hypothetical protein
VSSRDPIAFGAALIILIAVALVACFSPAVAPPASIPSAPCEFKFFI